VKSPFSLILFSGRNGKLWDFWNLVTYDKNTN